MGEKLYISNSEIAEYMWNKLLDLGYVPESDEVFDLADILFDFLIDKGVVTDVEEGEF